MRHKNPDPRFKICPTCERNLPTSKFFKKSKDSGHGGVYAYCKECTNQKTKNWRQSNPEALRNHALKQRYGITSEEWEIRLTAQGGVCAICGTDNPGGRGNFNTDHNHSCCPGRRTCGKCLRGLLCFSCNSKIGWYELRQVEIHRYISAVW